MRTKTAMNIQITWINSWVKLQYLKLQPRQDHIPKYNSHRAKGSIGASTTGQWDRPPTPQHQKQPTPPSPNIQFFISLLSCQEYQSKSTRIQES